MVTVCRMKNVTHKLFFLYAHNSWNETLFSEREVQQSVYLTFPREQRQKGEIQCSLMYCGRYVPKITPNK